MSRNRHPTPAERAEPTAVPLDPEEALLAIVQVDPDSEPLDEGEDHVIDPDPFTIGLAIFSAVAGGGAFLEARMQRKGDDRKYRDAFRASWYNARRTVIFFKRGVDEFETYLLEEGFGRKPFRIGSVRLMVDRQRHHALRRLRGQTFTTATLIGDNLDDLSEYLGAQEQEAVTNILTLLSEMQMPERYADVLRLAREAIALYSDFLDQVDEHQGFTAEDEK